MYIYLHIYLFLYRERQAQTYTCGIKPNFIGINSKTLIDFNEIKPLLTKLPDLHIVKKKNH